jgi:myo-inositol-1(or 4)-monophosphatase
LPAAATVAIAKGVNVEGARVTGTFDDLALVARATEIAREAGYIALRFFRNGEATTASVSHKDGGSPVTEADRRVDDFLREKLGELVSEAGWLSEETIDSADRLTRDRIFIVDPIDGTRGFMAGDLRWGVCVALAEHGEPVMGIVHMPALDATFVAVRGRGATRNGAPIKASVPDTLDGALIAGPVSSLKALARAGVSFRSEPRIPSLAYRLVRVAEGTLDAAIASTDACDWDIAAADLIVREAGGRLIDLNGRPPRYNREKTRHGVLCAASQNIRDPLVNALKESLGTGIA